MSSDLNRRLKRWPGWVVLGVVFVALLAVGVSRDSGPQNQRERIDEISKRLACPTCDGESVFESRASSSENLRREIARLVADSKLSDDQIVQQLDDAYVEDLTLTPDATGLEGVAWFLPVVVTVLALGGLGFAFRRWKLMNDQHATAADRELVAAALGGSTAVSESVPGDPSEDVPGDESEDVPGDESVEDASDEDGDA